MKSRALRSSPSLICTISSPMVSGTVSRHPARHRRAPRPGERHGDRDEHRPDQPPRGQARARPYLKGLRVSQPPLKREGNEPLIRGGTPWAG
jgi:hypothetical protein